ncbi:TRM11 family SAM-dependent methyltransferase [Streptomyces mirabilis]|uniref:TRM11 family SAM-dependent methyltransferase n=1 Tax=Streptomyces mirabilis TaxID=68239 RepID=UPI00382176E3
MKTHAPLSVWNTTPASAPAQRADRYVRGSAAHPAKMLPQIAAHTFTTYARPGDLVLDPMCGSGTTLVEAVRLGRHALETEYEPQWATLADQNLRRADAQGAPGAGAVYRGDARHLTTLIPGAFHGLVDLVVTPPPTGPASTARSAPPAKPANAASSKGTTTTAATPETSPTSSSKPSWKPSPRSSSSAATCSAPAATP